MKKERYRKLDMDLPKVPVVDQRPFIAGGWLLLVLIFIIALVAYRQQKEGAIKKKEVPSTTQKTS